MRTRKTTLLIVALAASSNALADNKVVKVTEYNRHIIEELVASGDLLPTEDLDWYEINPSVMRQALINAENGDEIAKQTIERLRQLVGEDSNPMQLPIIKAKIGSQDVF